MTLPKGISKAICARHRDDTLRLIFPLGNCQLEQAAGSAGELILTLQTSDGFEVAFSVDLDAIGQISQTAGSTLATPARSRTYLN